MNEVTQAKIRLLEGEIAQHAHAMETAADQLKELEGSAAMRVVQQTVALLIANTEESGIANLEGSDFKRGEIKGGLDAYHTVQLIPTALAGAIVRHSTAITDKRTQIQKLRSQP